MVGGKLVVRVVVLIPPGANEVKEFARKIGIVRRAKISPLNAIAGVQGYVMADT
jgi:hypothetical protein